MLIEDVRCALAAARAAWHGQSQRTRGVYGVYLVEGYSLPGLTAADDGLLYIGHNMTGASHLDHLAAGADATSALRSLGALLQRELALELAPSTAWDDGFSFSFTAPSEARLSAWMAKALHVAQLPLGGDTAQTRALLVGQLEPPLNLSGWRNPQRSHILSMRRACAYGAHTDLA
tara:strand:- start:104192 stop:104716 length:525 start_codon:yes stop_codon:yes gene_type:complete